jgi:hypothetical protein
MCFDVENECTRKKFQECNMRDFFEIKNTKGIYFLGIFLGCSYLKIFQIPTYLMFFLMKN